MKIVHVVTRMIVGGAQENTLLSCRGLARDFGDDVLLVCGPETGPEGDLFSQTSVAGVPLEIIPSLKRRIAPLSDLACLRALVKLLQRERPDVVHTHSAKAGVLGRLAARLCGVPAVVHTVHGAPWHRFQPRLLRWGAMLCEALAGTWCDRLIGVADAMGDQMVSSGWFPAEKFVTIRSGMETGPFLAAKTHREEARRRLNLPDDAVIVGKIARLSPLKGHEFLLDAAKRLRPRRPELHYLLVGDGALRKRFEREVAAAGLSDRFRFTGLVRPEEIPFWLGAMDLLAHASLREGLARALPQALLAGVPVVSFDLDGAREVVFPGRTGFLTAAEEGAALAEAIERLAVDPELRRRMGEAGAADCKERFDHRAMTAAIRREYVALLELEGAARPAEPASAPPRPPAGRNGK